MIIKRLFLLFKYYPENQLIFEKFLFTGTFGTDLGINME